MKNKYRSMISMLLILIFILSATMIKGDLKETGSYPDIGTYQKDETIYIDLDPNGKTVEVNVVNRLETLIPGKYTDFGMYENVKPLSKAIKQDISDESISWSLDADTNGFYYQGTLKDPVLPYLFSITYELDGIEMTPAKILGKHGRIKILLSIGSNPDSIDYFRNNYFCQIQTGLDVEKHTDISAVDSTKVLIGKTMNLSYTVLPGKSAAHEIAFTTESFEFSGFTITCLPFNNSIASDVDIDEMLTGFSKLSIGTQDMIFGTTELKSGMEQLSGGIEQLSDSSSDIKDGLGEYTNGFSSYSKNISTLTKQANTIAGNLSAMSDNGSALKDSFSQLNSQLDILISSLDEETAAKLSSSIKEYKQGLYAFTSGIYELSKGMSSFAAGLKTLDARGAGLLPSIKSILDGMLIFQEALIGTSGELQKIPSVIQSLIDGQTQIKSGIDAAGSGLAAFSFPAPDDKIVSFVSDKNTNVKSVQFIYKTKEIVLLQDNGINTQPETKKKGFFEKFADLFK